MKDRYAYVIVQRGGWDMWVRGRTYSVNPGDVVLKQPGEVYRDLRRDGPSTFEVVLLDGVATSELVFDRPVLAADDARVRPLADLRGAIAANASGLALEQAIAGAWRALGAASGTETTLTRERSAVARARAYLRERLVEAVTLDELADHVRLDKHHLIHAFRAEMGLPPYEYLTHLRILRARELLRAGLPVVRVAAALGYYDQSQLHRHFKRIVGATPGAYARAHRS